MEARFRSRYGRLAVFRAAAVVFLACCVLIAAVVFTLDVNARRSNVEQAATELASSARVAASTFSTMHANLRTRVGELASSMSLQEAVVRKNGVRIRAVALAHNARVTMGSRIFGRLPSGPRIAATATMARQGRAVAHVTIAVPMDRSFLDVVAASTPMPKHAALMLVRGDRVVAGGPLGARADVKGGRMTLGSVDFRAKAAKLGTTGMSIAAIEPDAAVAAQLTGYRRRLLFAAALTLALAAGLATRIARPVARVLADLARMTRQAQTDALTNLANRRALDERLDDEVEHARRLNTHLAFVIADIDNFKSINDRFGHQTGDEVLRRVARVFAEAVRELDLPGRFGGEEIALVLPGTNLTGARNLAERIRKSVEDLQVPTPEGDPLQVTASFGAACFPTHSSAGELVAAADAALYDAKRDGKNRVVTATAKKKSRTAAVDEPLPV
jgi:diguanylate cyclase (GGDEF)-like protein